MAENNDRHWLLWDGDCGFCRRSAAWVRRRDVQNRFRIVPYQEAPSPPMTPALKLACERAVHVIKSDGTTLRAGRATLFILELTGWGLFAKLLALQPFVWVVELWYWIVARNRDLFSKLMFRAEDDHSHEPAGGDSTE